MRAPEKPTDLQITAFKNGVGPAIEGAVAACGDSLLARGRQEGWLAWEEKLLSYADANSAERVIQWLTKSESE